MNIKKVKLTKENLLKIQKIDNLFYGNNTIKIQWYLERYNENHNAYVLTDGNNYYGYAVAVPIKEELYNAIVNGVITNDLYINPSMFINESDFYYIVSMVLLEDYRNKGYGKQIADKMLIDIKDKKCCALTISKEGYNIAKKYLTMIKSLNNDTSVFVNEKY